MEKRLKIFFFPGNKVEGQCLAFAYGCYSITMSVINRETGSPHEMEIPKASVAECTERTITLKDRNYGIFQPLENDDWIYIALYWLPFNTHPSLWLPLPKCVVERIVDVETDKQLWPKKEAA